MAPVTSTSRSKRQHTVSRAIQFAVACMLIGYCLLGCTFLVREVSHLFLLSDAGYGDSYILYDVLKFVETNTIYRDLAQPPYMPAQYSPAVYTLYSLPGRIADWDNPFVGPRLLVIAAFVACTALAASIANALIPVRRIWVSAILLVCSIGSMWSWVLQIRGDFPGIVFSLLALRLLLSPRKWAIYLAGISAGLAIQFKITFVALGIAAVIWFLLRRRWKDLAAFTVLAAISSIGLYLAYFLREPRMLSQMLALSPGVLNVSGGVELMRQTLTEPVVLLALLSFPPLTSRVWPRWTLVVIFVLASFGVAALTCLQAGGNINYYFEGHFAAIPLAVLGALRLLAMARRNLLLGALVAGLFASYFLVPRAKGLFEMGNNSIHVAEANEAFQKVATALRGQRIFSTVPRLALLDDNPTLVEPYLLSYLHHLGKADPKVISDRIRSREYDVVITGASAASWRGIPHIDSDLRDAIADTYRPHCTFRGVLFHFPESSSNNAILDRTLAAIDCTATASVDLQW